MNSESPIVLATMWTSSNCQVMMSDGYENNAVAWNAQSALYVTDVSCSRLGRRLSNASTQPSTDVSQCAAFGENNRLFYGRAEQITYLNRGFRRWMPTGHRTRWRCTRQRRTEFHAYFYTGRTRRAFGKKIRQLSVDRTDSTPVVFFRYRRCVVVVSVSATLEPEKTKRNVEISSLIGKHKTKIKKKNLPIRNAYAEREMRCVDCRRAQARTVIVFVIWDNFNII